MVDFLLQSTVFFSKIKNNCHGFFLHSSTVKKQRHNQCLGLSLQVYAKNVFVSLKLLAIYSFLRHRSRWFMGIECLDALNRFFYTFTQFVDNGVAGGLLPKMPLYLCYLLSHPTNYAVVTLCSLEKQQTQCELTERHLFICREVKANHRNKNLFQSSLVQFSSAPLSPMHTQWSCSLRKRERKKNTACYFGMILEFTNKRQVCHIHLLIPSCFCCYSHSETPLNATSPNSHNLSFCHCCCQSTRDFLPPRRLRCYISHAFPFLNVQPQNQPLPFAM